MYNPSNVQHYNKLDMIEYMRDCMFINYAETAIHTVSVFDQMHHSMNICSSTKFSQDRQTVLNEISVLALFEYFLKIELDMRNKT